METLAIGELRIDHVEEFWFSECPAHQLLSGLPDDAVERNLHWLAPDFYDAVAGHVLSASHTWVVRTPHHNILVDTCCGNDKPRPAFEICNRLSVPYLERLAAHDLAPADIDFVMCTHLHLDHVGWNTRLQDGRWVPTFPNARYIFGRREYEYWSALEQSGQQDPVNAGVYEDSILPVVEAGMTQLVDDGFTIDDTLTVEEASGHSEGHVVIRASSNGRSGIFTGDLMHTPLQVPYPDVNSIYCQFPERARAARRRVLEDCAEHGHLLLPAHFTSPYIGRVATDGDTFRFLPGR